MNEKPVKIVRIYMLESQGLADEVLNILHDEEKVSGVTIMRGIAGYGASGRVHTASLLELSLDLPIVLEFFDEPEHADAVITKLRNRLQVKHIVSWLAVSYHGVD